MITEDVTLCASTKTNHGLSLTEITNTRTLLMVDAIFSCTCKPNRPTDKTDTHTRRDSREHHW